MVYEKRSPRAIAVEILSKVFDRNIPLKILINDKKVESLSPVDRAFLRELVYGVLRNLYIIDWLLKDFYRDRKSLSSRTINNLRCGIYQEVFMEIPDYAVTNETVKVEKYFKGKPSFVNAVLRNFIRLKVNKLRQLESTLSEFKRNNKLDFLSLKYSHPKWLVKRWIDRFGEIETEALLNANNQKPPFTIAVKPDEREKVGEYLKERGFIINFTPYSPCGILVEGQGQQIRNTLRDCDFFWLIQDEASQLACYFLEPVEGIELLDLCSSPGGKALLTAALMREGRLVCLEKDKGRFEILNQNIQRLKKHLPNVKIEALLIDAFNFKSKGKFDRVLLDAPCSSLGVIRRNPDVKYRCSDHEIEKLAKNQSLLLEHASKFLSKKGFLIYVVCSTEVEEGEQIVENFLLKFKEFYTINSVYSFFKDFYIKEGFIRTFPHRHNMDGFFMARLSRL